MVRSFNSTYRKVQDAERARLHQFASTGDLRGFVMPYLGQQDRALHAAHCSVPADLVPLDAVARYPTNFAPMSADAFDAVATRGEQLTRLLIERWAPKL
jgi:NTE family protein